MSDTGSRLLVFSKAPVPGLVKTRLVPLLGTAGATVLHCELLESTLLKLTASTRWSVELHCAPGIEHDYFQYCRQRFPLTLHPQASGDLGERMSAALAGGLQQADAAVLVGSDCPGLSTAEIESALEQLEAGEDVVFGPALDGGYYLVAMRTHHAGLFSDIPWGSGAVLETSLQRARRLGLRFSLLSPLRDIDTAEDYQAWRAATSGG
jgi:rSAM/selenodomain-associated transferase 1